MWNKPGLFSWQRKLATMKSFSSCLQPFTLLWELPFDGNCSAHLNSFHYFFHIVTFDSFHLLPFNCFCSASFQLKTKKGKKNIKSNKMKLDKWKKPIQQIENFLGNASFIQSSNVPCGNEYVIRHNWQCACTALFPLMMSSFRFIYFFITFTVLQDCRVQTVRFLGGLPSGSYEPQILRA